MFSIGLIRRCTRCNLARATPRVGLSTYGSWVPGSGKADGNVFGGYADEYDVHRPGYPGKMWDEVISQLRLLGHSCNDGTCGNVVAVDVATGTGRGAIELSRRGLDVIALDYDSGMLNEVERQAAKVLGSDSRLRTHMGKAEATGLPAGCAHLVTALQSFHWFDANAALTEFHRLMARSVVGLQDAPGGLVVLAWNDRDLSVPWMQEYEDIIERYNPKYSRSLKQAETVVDHGRALKASGLFDILDCVSDSAFDGDVKPGPIVIPNPTPGYTLEAVTALNRTFSYIRNALSESELESLEGEMTDLVRANFNGEEPTFDYPWVCKAWILRPVHVP